MPITGVNSYPLTAEEFSNHWAAVNTSLGTAGPLVLPDGTTRGTFELRVSQMNAAFAAIPVAAGAEQTASANLKLKRETLQPRMVQFGQSIRLYLAHSRFANAAPKTPTLTEGEQTYRTAGETILARWAEINAATDLAPFTPPLTLPGGGISPGTNYSRAQFESDWQAVMDAFSADLLAGEDATQKRANRNALLPQIYQHMKDYRATCLLVLPKDSPLRATLPRLTPPPGTTPPPLGAVGQWVPTISKARLTWTATTDPTVNKIQIRGCTGGSYKNNDETIVADLAANAVQWEGDWGLIVSGAIASFKAYAMTTTGNENGGKAVKIVRPET